MGLRCRPYGGIIGHMAVIDFKRPLVLATASPARRQLVADVGLDFIADAVDVDETPSPGEAVGDYVSRLARAKADKAVPPSLDAAIVAVDTAIGLDGEIIGKPMDRKHAGEMLSKLSDRFHDVAGAIAVRDIAAGKTRMEITKTSVKFVKLTEGMLDWYIGTGEWKNRAGAYAIQGRGAALIAEVRGCFTNVIGISIPSLLRLLGRCVVCGEE